MDDNLKKWLPWIAVAAVAVIVIAIIAFNSDGDDAASGGDTTTSSTAVETTTSEAEETTTTSEPEETTTTAAPVVVRVGVENAYVPFNFIDENGNGVGFDYDIWTEICDRLGCTAEFVEAGWPAVIQETADGVYDVAADGISITDERKKIVDYSVPYMTTIQRYMVRIDEDRFASAAEFDAGDYQIGTQVGTTNYDLALERVGDARIDAFDLFSLAVEALDAGQVDAVIIDDVAGQGYLGVSADKLRMLEGDENALQSDPLGFIYPQGSELTAQVDQVIADMLADGTLEALITEWFIDFEA